MRKLIEAIEARIKLEKEMPEDTFARTYLIVLLEGIRRQATEEQARLINELESIISLGANNHDFDAGLNEAIRILKGEETS